MLSVSYESVEAAVSRAVMVNGSPQPWRYLCIDEGGLEKDENVACHCKRNLVA
jgi:hypothetical protein